jgi:hypothetical protein
MEALCAAHHTTALGCRSRLFLTCQSLDFCPAYAHVWLPFVAHTTNRDGGLSIAEEPVARDDGLRRLICEHYPFPIAQVVMSKAFDFPIGGFSPPEERLARGFKPPAFSRFLFQSAVKSAESF